MHETLYTIGHSNHSIEQFLQLLVEHQVTAIADVRSRPYSRMHPQFNRENLYSSLKATGVAYAFLGRELGARTEDRSCYVEGKVRYELLSRTDSFQEGLTRLRDGIRQHRIALLCAEKDPITCHRMILVCHALRRQMEIAHISPNGALESNADAEKRLLDATGLPQTDLFTSGDDAIEEAYSLQSQRIAWVEPAKAPAEHLDAFADTESYL